VVKAESEKPLSPRLWPNGTTENQIPCTLLDLDIENKKKGSFPISFPTGPLRSTSTPRRASMPLSTMPTRNRTSSWPTWARAAAKFPPLVQFHVRVGADTLSFTAIGVVTSDPASVESLLNWAAQLQDRVSYVVVLNQQEDIQVGFHLLGKYHGSLPSARPFSPPSSAWRHACRICSTPCATMGLPSVQVSPRSVWDGIGKSSLVVRAQAYRRQLFAEFDRIKEALLP
jgi:hypothetical protein